MAACRSSRGGASIEQALRFVHARGRSQSSRGQAQHERSQQPRCKSGLYDLPAIPRPRIPAPVFWERCLRISRRFDSDLVRRLTDTTTINLDALIAGEPISLYIIVPPLRLLTAYRPLLRLWLSGFILAMTHRKTPPTERTLTPAMKSATWVKLTPS